MACKDTDKENISKKELQLFSHLQKSHKLKKNNRNQTAK